ncbi:MAG TPA: ATP-binding protein [Streptosporangiaceae bacterium]
MPVTSGAPDPASGASQTPSGSAPALRWRRVFPGEERQLGLLRRWLALLFPPCPARDDVTAIASELSGNALRHTASGRGGLFTVEVAWHGPVVRVAVADGGAATEPRVIDDPAAEHGRGLLVVRELSVRMGVCGDRRGRLVWADVRWDASPRSAVAGADGYDDAIRDGQAALARRFAGVPAWFGRATLAWWALAGPDGLVSAATAGELAGLLYRLSTHDAAQSPVTEDVRGRASEPARGRGAAQLEGSGHRQNRPAIAGAGARPARTVYPAVVPGLMPTGAT